MPTLRGNKFQESSSVKPDPSVQKFVSGISRSNFHLADRAGVMFPMHMGDMASYTINYHHSGGPRCYAVIEPRHYQKVDKLLCIAKDSEEPKAPTCSAHVSHKRMYVPTHVLTQHNIAFKQVTQFLGEMIIMFPYAYYQGFNAGPNIIEESFYATEQWKTFYQRGLFIPCHENCLLGAEDFNFDFAKMPAGQEIDTSDDEQEDEPLFVSDGENTEVAGEVDDSAWATTEDDATEQEQEEEEENSGEEEEEEMPLSKRRKYDDTRGTK